MNSQHFNNLIDLLKKGQDNPAQQECLRVLETKSSSSIDTPEPLDAEHIRMVYKRRLKHYQSVDEESKERIVGLEQLVNNLEKFTGNKLLIVNVTTNQLTFLIFITLAWELIGIVKSSVSKMH